MFLFECNIRGENACVPVWKYDINTSSPFAGWTSSIDYNEERAFEDDPQGLDKPFFQPMTYKEVAALCFEEYRHDVALKLKRQYGS